MIRNPFQPHRIGRLISASVAIAAATATACAHNTIEGTNIPDTPPNREVVQVLVDLRKAMQERDADALLSLVSANYFEDMGTADPSDDYGYNELKAQIAKETLNAATEVFINFELHEVRVVGDRALADYRYNSRARIELPSGQSLWDSHREFNRIELTKSKNGRWLIVSGL